MATKFPNYTDPIMGMQSAPMPATQGFINIDPATGLPRMLPTARGAGIGDLSMLIGAPRDTVNPLGGMPGMGPMPVPGAPGADPSALTGLGGVNPTPGPNPLPGVDPSGQLPSYILNQFGSNLAGALRGELPEDVQNLLAQQSAEYGVGSGTQGSQFQGYRGLRNLGLTSLDRMKDAEALVAGQFTKPSEKLALDQKSRELDILKDKADKAYGLDKQKLEAELKLEREKFAEQVNQFNRKFQQDELQALGLKYGGGGVTTSGGVKGGSGGFTGASGLPIRTYMYGGENGPGPLQRLF